MDGWEAFSLEEGIAWARCGGRKCKTCLKKGVPHVVGIRHPRKAISQDWKPEAGGSDGGANASKTCCGEQSLWKSWRGVRT
jgi:hypothetical protein